MRQSRRNTCHALTCIEAQHRPHRYFELVMPPLTAPPNGIVELRQYTLHPGRRDALIALFEREFVETQEAAGITLLGQFRDLADPDRFVWLRAFADMPARARALAAFYDGPVWRAHRDAANATMLDSDNVLLLRPAPRGAAMPIDRWRRGNGAARDGAVLAAVAAPASEALIAALDALLAPTSAQAGGEVVARYATEGSANTFARLPVREGESVVVWLTRFDDRAACGRTADALARAFGALADAAAHAGNRLIAPTIQLLRLAPTPRSRF
jgi:quinol monooxygenase YgiN